MAVSSTTTRVAYTGDGTTNALSFPWIYWSPGDIKVYSVVTATGAATLWTQGGQYNLTGGSGAAGSVVPTSGTVVGTYTLIILDPVETHLTSYVPNEPFPSQAVQADFDRITQMVQSVDAQMGYTINFPYTEVSPPAILPAPSIRASKFLSFDSSGNLSLASGVSSVPLNQGNIGAALWPQTAAELAASVTPTNYGYAPVGQEGQGPQRYGIVGDGSTSDTTGISNSMSILSGAVVNLSRTSASYLMGAVSLSIPSILQGGGKISLSGANAGFQLHANFAGMAFRDLEVVGDANTANLHRMVWNDGTRTLSGLRINNVYVHGCVQNIDISTVTDSSITGNRIDSAAGSSAGQGYGIVGSKSKRVAIAANTFYANGRHSIYQSSVNYNALTGNISYQNAGTGSSSAIPVTRLATGMAITGNVLAEYVGTGMSIDSDNADGNGTCRAIQVIGNVFYQAPGSTNTNPDLAIGSSVPATNPLQTISVRGNTFTPSPVRQNGFIVVTNGLNLDISDNIFDSYLGTVASQYAINLDAAAGAAYYDRIRICGNTGVLVSSGGATTFVSVGANICTGTQAVDIFNNTVTCGAVISYATTPTNPNIKHDVFVTNSVTLGAGSADFNIAGYYDFAITGNGGGSTIANITNGYPGKVITLRFVDANVTVSRTNCFLAGSVNFVSANHSMLVLKFLAGNWFEISRGVDG